MSKLILLLIALLVQIVPSFVGHLLSVDGAFTMYYLSDKLVILVLISCIIKSIKPVKSFTMLLGVLVLIAGLALLGNFLVIKEPYQHDLFNNVSEKANG